MEIGFNGLLRRAGINKVRLAECLGLQVGTIYGWKDSPPGYAIAYLELLIEYNRYRP